MKKLWYILIISFCLFLTDMARAESRSLDPMEVGIPVTERISRSSSPMEQPTLPSDPLVNPQTRTNPRVPVDQFYTRTVPLKVASTFDEKTVTPSTITNAMIRDESIDNNKLTSNSVSTTNIVNGSVTSAKLDNHLIKYSYLYLTPAQVANLTSTPQFLFFGVPVMFVITHGNPGATYPGGGPAAYGSVGASDKIRIRSSDTISTYVTWGELDMVGFLDSIDRRAIVYAPSGVHTPVLMSDYYFEVMNPGDGITAGGQGVVIDFWYIPLINKVSDVS